MGTLTIDMGYGQTVKAHDVLTKLLNKVNSLDQEETLVLTQLSGILWRAIEQREKLMNKEQAQND